MNEELLKALSQLMDSRFSGLTKSIRKNLVVLTSAFILVLFAVRSGQGRLSLAALARVLPTQGTAHAREKRLHRFLENPRLDFRTVTGSLAEGYGCQFKIGRSLLQACRESDAESRERKDH